MKLRYMLFAGVVGSATLISAQNTQISVGADVGIPVGDFGDIASLIIGPSLGVEFPVGDRIGITLQAGYQFVSVVDEYGIAFGDRRILNRTFNMIPAQAGVKYYFAEPQLGFYAHAQAGIHAVARRYDALTVDFPGFDPLVIPGTDVNHTAFSWALGVGYQLQNLDVGVRFNAIGPHDLEPNTVAVAGSEFAYSYRSPALSYVGIRIAYIFNLGGA